MSATMISLFAGFKATPLGLTNWLLGPQICQRGAVRHRSLEAPFHSLWSVLNPSHGFTSLKPAICD